MEDHASRAKGKTLGLEDAVHRGIAMPHVVMAGAALSLCAWLEAIEYQLSRIADRPSGPRAFHCMNCGKQVVPLVAEDNDG